MHNRSRYLFGVAALTIAGSLGSSRLSAQGRIVGVVVDSLRGGVPLSGATVVLVSSNRYASADSLGRFAFDSVTGGAQQLALLHSSLDALDVSLPPVTVSVAGSGETSVTLAIPAVRSMHRMICGVDAPAGAGIVVGTVARPGQTAIDSTVRVDASWNEMQIEDGKLARIPRSVSLAPDANGTFLLCGVPSAPRVTIVASAGRDTIGATAVTLGGLGIARVTLPESRTVAVGPDGRPVQQLAGVAVRAEAAPKSAPAAFGSYAGFEERRRMGLGAFLVVDQQTRDRSQNLTDVLQGMRGLTFDGRGRNRMPLMRGFMAPRCIPNYFVDGTYIKVDSDAPRASSFALTFSDLEANVPASQISAVEVYASPVGIPPAYDMSGHTGCGTILIWTNRTRS